MKFKSFFLKIFILLFVLLIVCVVALLTGTYEISLNNLFSDFAKSEELQQVILELRLPRVMAAMLSGAILALGGLSFQTILRNPLADPYLLGVSSGASLGVLIALMIPNFVGFYYLTPLAAFIGALISIGIVFFLIPWAFFRKRMSFSSEHFIVAGVITSFFFNSLIILIISFSNDASLTRIFYWLIGSLANSEFEKNIVATIYLIILFPFFIYFSKDLNLIAFGDETALSLGVNPFKTKKIILISASLITAVIVSITGPIGFVGLIIPHFVKIIFGFDHRKNVIYAPLIGAIFMVLADLLSRTISTSIEIPVGAITTFIGAPIFILILSGLRKHS